MGRQVGINILVALSIMIAGAVVIFWLREIDLSFLVRLRHLVLPLVVLSGIVLGVGMGLQLGKDRIGASERLPLAVISIVGALFLLFPISGCVSAYWQASERVPVSLPAITEALFNLLLSVTMFIYAGTSGMVLLRGWKRTEKALENSQAE
ncbi:MAG: hypothetical protein ACYC7E_18695 [Armatimonadota bacterium]